MKIRKFVTSLAVLSGVATMPMTANAATLALGNWSVAGGTISSGCPLPASSTLTCGTPTTLASGDGFLQEEIPILNGTTIEGTYIRTIVTEAGVNGNAGNLSYSDESIIKSGGLNSGILSSQTIKDASKGFDSTSSLKMGWAGDTANNTSTVSVVQNFVDTGPLVGGVDLKGDTFRNSFGLDVVVDNASGNAVGKAMSIDQVVEMGDYVKDNLSDVQRFVVEQRSGTVTTANPAGMTLVTGQDTNGNDITTTVPWAANDDIMVVWLGQQVANGPDDPNTTAFDPPLSVFGFERVTNTTNKDLATLYANDGDPNTDPASVPTYEAVASSTTSTDVTATPFAWDALFQNDFNGDGTVTAGEAPALPAIQ